MFGASLLLAAHLLLPDCWIERAWPECDNGNVHDGFWWTHGPAWVPEYPTEEEHFARLPIAYTGRAAWYAPHVMEGTARVRGYSLDGYVGGVALMSCGHMGESVWIGVDGRIEGPFLVADCPRRGDWYPVRVYRQEAVEVDWNTHTRWGPGVRDVVVFHYKPPELAGVRPERLSTWAP